MLIRPYKDSDCDAVLRVWERALPLDAVSRDEFQRRVLLDVNREPGGFLVAEIEGAIAGFIVCFVLLQPIEKSGQMPDRGFITAFAVDPACQRAGVGTALLDASEAFFRHRDRKLILLAPYTPNYFVPGIDKVNYAAGLAFLQKRGFVDYSEAIAMDASIGTFRMDDEVIALEEKLVGEGITFRPFSADVLVQFMTFMQDVMPGPWIEDARRNLRDYTHGRFPEDAIQLAFDGIEIVGYCQFEGEHFGPFGVVDSHQGRGIGKVILARTLAAMKRHGIHNAFVLWTGERAARGVYGRLGFTISRRFAILKKPIA